MKNPNENEEEMEEREWVINGFKTFSAIAQEYFPEYSNADTYIAGIPVGSLAAKE